MVTTITGLTAERMQEIIDQQLVSGAVDLSGHLIFTREDGSTLDAGVVKGDKGDSPTSVIPGFPSGGNPVYVRLATIDGLNDTNGASLQFQLSGIGNFGSTKRGTVLVHFGQRGTDIVDVKAWSFGFESLGANPLRLFTRKMGAFLFEIWAQFGIWTAKPTFTELSNWRGTVQLDSLTTVAPTSPALVEWTIDASPSGIATNAEALTGTDTSKAMTPATTRYVQDQNYAKALLDPTYKGPGPARVSFLPGGSLSTEYYQMECKWRPWDNRVVNMRRRNGTWVITGPSGEEGYGGKIDLYPYLVNGWNPYTLSVVDVPQRWAWPRAQKLVSGIVVLQGLIGYGTITSGTVILNLPPGYRPDTKIIVGINNGDNPRGLEIRANGDVVTRGTWVASTYISLDGIAFPAAGVATWTNIGAAGSGSAFANGWSAYDTANWGPPRFWKDPYGFVWFSGLIGGGSTASDNLIMFTMPSSHMPSRMTHTKAVSQDAFGFVSAIPTTGGIGWKTGTAGNAWISLSGTIIPSADADSLSWLTLNLSNGWVTYDASQYTLNQVVRRPDGLAAARGLTRGGTAPSIKLSAVPEWALPEPGIILYGVNTQAFNRQDIVGSRVIEDATAPGQFRITGSNGWNSWDGHVWMVGD